MNSAGFEEINGKVFRDEFRTDEPGLSQIA